MKISAVIALYDEAENIIELIQRLIGVLSTLKVEYEIILIVQGRDGSQELLQDFKQKTQSQIKIFYYEEPLGVGLAFKIGFHQISEDVTHVLTMDADLNHRPEDLPKFFEALSTEGSDIIIGSRYIPGGVMKGVYRWRYILSKEVNIALSYLTRLKIKDKSSGYRLQRKRVVVALRDKIKAKNFDFYVDYLIMAQKAGFSMYEIPIVFIARTKGHSKMKVLDTLLRYLILIMRRSSVAILAKNLYKKIFNQAKDDD
ncbi:glycosyltransferase [Candidatus Omnitrophota bacterium]